MVGPNMRRFERRCGLAANVHLPWSLLSSFNCVCASLVYQTVEGIGANSPTPPLLSPRFGEDAYAYFLSCMPLPCTPPGH